MLLSPPEVCLGASFTPFQITEHVPRAPIPTRKAEVPAWQAVSIPLPPFHLARPSCSSVTRRGDGVMCPIWHQDSKSMKYCRNDHCISLWDPASLKVKLMLATCKESKLCAQQACGLAIMNMSIETTCFTPAPSASSHACRKQDRRHSHMIQTPPKHNPSDG